MRTVFVDSTTLLYPLDPNEPLKQAKSRAWLRALRQAQLLVTSPQVLNECYWVGSRKAAFAGSRSVLRDYVRAMAPWTTAPLTPSVLEEAWALSDRYKVGFWYSLLLASANAAACSHFISEELNDGQLYGGVTVIDPFRHTPEDVLGRALLS